MKNKPNRGQKYFPNNWRAVRDLPEEFLPSLSYEELKEWKCHQYVIPDSVFGIIRIEDNNTGKYVEKYYNTKRGAEACITQAMRENKSITMATMDGMYHLSPEPPTDWI
jgi:hypothetical protein|tara:strand:- start:282 stop:608 length:327 start_codon:yes stop_codon:yes gene_type:complete